MKPLDVAIAFLIGTVGTVVFASCSFARVRYLDGAERSDRLECVVDVNTLVCRPFYRALAQDGVQLIPSNSRERIDM